MLCKTPEQKAIWDRVEERIEAAPKDGINAEGHYSDSVYWSQHGYINGLHAGRLAAVNALSHGQRTGDSR
jgi:hypothetical protein